MTDWRDDDSGRDYVYFAHLGDYVKVGKSYDPETRVERIRYYGGGIALPRRYVPGIRLHSIHAVPGGFREERQAHAALAEYREVGEWFIAEPPLLEWVSRQTSAPFAYLPRTEGQYEPPQRNLTPEVSALLKHLFGPTPQTALGAPPAEVG